MFGKHSGAPWIKKQAENNQLNPILANELNSDNKILKQNSKVRKQALKNEENKNKTLLNKLANETENNTSDRSEDESKTKKNFVDQEIIRQEFKTINQNFGNYFLFILII